jgi:hypothetical protein
MAWLETRAAGAEEEPPASELSSGSSSSGGSGPSSSPARSSSRDRHGDDDIYSEIVQPLALAVVATMCGWAVWHWLWGPWAVFEARQLEAMHAEASVFYDAHPIETDAGPQAFARSRDRWWFDIVQLHEGFRAATTASLLRPAPGAGLADPTALLLCLAATGAASGASLFLPDAAILIPVPARHALRTALNSVKFGRPLICALFALELRQLYRMLCTASAVAAAGSASVQRLQKLQEALMLQGRPVLDYNLHAEMYRSKRWGIRLPVSLDHAGCPDAPADAPCSLSQAGRSFAIDARFWEECRFNGLVGLVLCGLLALWFWSLVNDARERQGKRRRGIAEKAAANVFVSRRVRTQLQQAASRRPLATATELEFSSLGPGPPGAFVCVIIVCMGA